MVPIVSAVPISTVLPTIVTVVPTMRAGTAMVSRTSRAGPMFMPISGTMAVGGSVVI